MNTDEYTQLSNKIDKLDAKIDSQMIPRPEYEKAHEALQLRVQVVEQRVDAWGVAGRAELNKLETDNGVKYDKLDAKIDGLKDNMVLRFENLATQQAANRRSTFQWSIGIIVGMLGGGGIGSLVWYLAHLAHP